MQGKYTGKTIHQWLGAPMTKHQVTYLILLFPPYLTHVTCTLSFLIFSYLSLSFALFAKVLLVHYAFAIICHFLVYVNSFSAITHPVFTRTHLAHITSYTRKNQHHREWCPHLTKKTLPIHLIQVVLYFFIPCCIY